MSLTLLAIFLVLGAIGVPLAAALGLASVAAILLYTSTPVDLLAQSMFSAMNSFLLVAVPLFILVGVLMERGKVAEKLFDFAEAMVGWAAANDQVEAVLGPASAANLRALADQVASDAFLVAFKGEAVPVVASDQHQN